MRRFIGSGILACAVALACASPARAEEWQIKPFAGVTFGGSTTFVDLDKAAGDPKLNIGISGLWLGDVFGLEGDLATTSGFFSGDANSQQTLILKSHVATFTGNVVVALPKHIAQYGLRPYVVGGLGGMHVGWYDKFAALPYANTLWAWDVGGGATGFLNDVVGLNWDVRYFRTLGSEQAVTGASYGPEQLSFWRAVMGITFRL